MTLKTIGFILGSLALSALAQVPTAIASSYSLTASTSLPFPTATQVSSNTNTHIVQSWSLSGNKVEDLGSDLEFVADPFDSNNTLPVLQAFYPAGSYSHDSGGSQFYSQFNQSGSSFQSMLVSYEVAFDDNFQWVQGGKLPGMRGGPYINGCDGGDQPNGTDCFSTRLMWRPEGQGELYGYLLHTNDLCSQPNITCGTTDFGVSIQRGAFTFQTGQWSRISLLVQLNSPTSRVNAQAQIYFNDALVITQQNLQLRTSTDVDVGGFWFSTFFGGNDDTWATPVDTYTYYRNIQMWASSNPSNSVGVAAGARAITPSVVLTSICLGMGIAAAFVL